MAARDGGRPEAPLQLHDLLVDAGTLAGVLAERVATADWLDAFLVAAGITQIIDDALHRDVLELQRLAERLRRGAHDGPRRAIAAAAGGTAAAAWSLRVHTPGRGIPGRFGRDAAELATLLADRLMGGGSEALAEAGAAAAAHRLHDLAARLPHRMRTTPVRMPSCFRNFDQTPEDVRRLAERVSARWPDRRRRVLVVGIRTSGSYLAPLAAAALRARGHERVAWTTVRPGQRWLPRERRALADSAGAGALAVLMDDPPISWGSVAEGARLLTALGFEAASVVLALHVFAAASAPPGALRAHPTVLMPWEEWEVRARLEPDAVRDALASMLGAEASIGTVRRIGSTDGDGHRGHVHARFEVEVGGPGAAARRDVCVRGVGLGYFGTHSLAVSSALADFVPAVHGVRDGLMFRDWVPEVDRLPHDAEDDLVARAVAGYVHARARALPAGRDGSRRLSRRATVLGRAADILSRSFGRAHGLAWPLCARAVLPLLEAGEPSVVDGHTSLDAWFRGGPTGALKIGVDERAFCSLDLHCYDPVFDLAGAAGDGSPSLGDTLRRHYGDLSGAPVAPERWLLYQLVHLGELTRRGSGHDSQVERRMSAAVQRYVGEVLLGDLAVPASGALCALDIDGVLEAGPLGFSTTDRAGARALRALVLHGWRPVLATGRSVDDVRERCRNYRLPGGVAEYGAAVYVAGSGEVHDLLTDTDRERLASVRSTLARLPGVELDPGYQRAVRAHRRDATGRRRGLTRQQLAVVLDDVVDGGRIRTIQGTASTDFMVAEVTKATGLRALAGALGAPIAGGDGLALAVGDSLADLEMLGLTALGCAPRNAEPALRDAGVRVLPRPYQSGLHQAAGLLIGHRPGGCPTCREPRLSPEAQLLLALLGEPHLGLLGARAWASVVSLGRIAVATARATR